MEAPRSFDAIIIGAGAAGMFCAALAGQRGRRVLLIDHSEKPGRKILISGGGRCNFTNTGQRQTTFCPPTRISPSRRSAASLRPNSLQWSIGTGSPGTRRRSVSSSAMVLKANRRHAAGRMRGRGG